MAAARAADTADTDPERAVRGLHCADVGSMPCKGSAVPAYRADQQPRVNGFHRIIIGFLRIWIAIWRFNCYHYVADAGNALCLCGKAGVTLVGWPLPSVYATEGIIIPECPSGKQSDGKSIRIFSEGHLLICLKPFQNMACNCRKSSLHAKDDMELTLGAHFTQCTEELQIKNNLALVTGCQIRKELINYNQIAPCPDIFQRRPSSYPELLFGISDSGLLRKFRSQYSFYRSHPECSPTEYRKVTW